MYQNGLGTDHDYGTAANLYASSAEQGNSNAQYLLASLYQEGHGIECSRGKAIALFR